MSLSRSSVSVRMWSPCRPLGLKGVVDVSCWDGCKVGWVTDAETAEGMFSSVVDGENSGLASVSGWPLNELVRDEVGITKSSKPGGGSMFKSVSGSGACPSSLDCSEAPAPGLVTTPEAGGSGTKEGPPTCCCSEAGPSCC